MKRILLIFLCLTLTTIQARTVDKDKSTFKWYGDKKIGSGHWGYVKLKSAQVKMKGSKLNNAEFVIDMTTITVEDIEGKYAKKFLTHVKTEDFFEVKKFATATLVLNKQVNKNTVSGTLTVKNKSNPVTVKYDRKGRTYSGTLVFDRTKYGIVYGSDSFFKRLTADRVIKNQVRVDFKVVLK